MKSLRYCSCFAALFLAIMVQAQTIDIQACMDEATAELIGENNAVSLKNKMSRMITRSGMADASGIFCMIPSLAITDEGEVDTGMTVLLVLRAELTLSVKNVVDDKIFASHTLSLEATGKSREACMRSLINRVNVSDVRIAKMLKDVQTSINDYYARQIPVILEKAGAMLACRQYEDALVVLSLVPETVSDYAKVSDMKVNVYREMRKEELAREQAAKMKTVPHDSLVAAANETAKALKEERSKEESGKGQSLGVWLLKKINLK